MNVLIVAVPRSRWADFGGVPEWRWFLSWVVLFLFNVVVHEMGHVTMALLLSHRVNVVNIGPCTFAKGPDEYSMKFEPKKLLAFGGYMGSVPIHCKNLRLRQVAIIAAGPIASLLGGACLVAARFSATASEKGYVPFFSWGAIVALFCFVVSLTPIGYSDGNMLVHLILKTRAGDLLLDHLRLSQNQMQPSTVTAHELRDTPARISEG
jgi:Zn-dependent protease